MSGYARQERATLTQLLADSGPEAPTLIPGWTARDLAAHLIVRERRPAGLGILVKPLAGRTERVRRKIGAKDWERLVATFASGPGVSVFALPGMEETLNVVEFFVHGEDIRRARPDWAPRDLDEGLAETLWNRLAKGARVLARHAPVGVVLRHPDGRKVVARKGTPLVTVSGDVGELTMFVYGRQQAARVQAEGAPEDIVALTGASLGL